MNVAFKESIDTTFTVSVRSEREAYLFVCINELLHSLGLLSEADYATNYAKVTDNEHFKLM